MSCLYTKKALWYIKRARWHQKSPMSFLYIKRAQWHIKRAQWYIKRALWASCNTHHSCVHNAMRHRTHMNWLPRTRLNAATHCYIPKQTYECMERDLWASSNTLFTPNSCVHNAIRHGTQWASYDTDIYQKSPYECIKRALWTSCNTLLTASQDTMSKSRHTSE